VDGDVCRTCRRVVKIWRGYGGRITRPCKRMRRSGSSWKEEQRWTLRPSMGCEIRYGYRWRDVRGSDSDTLSASPSLRAYPITRITSKGHSYISVPYIPSHPSVPAPHDSALVWGSLQGYMLTYPGRVPLATCGHWQPVTRR
jgi:hypothetical protein